MSKIKSEAETQSSIRWIISATKPYHGMVLFLSFLAISTATLSLWSAVLLRNLIDAAASRDSELLIRTTLILSAVMLSSIALGLLSRYLKERSYYLTINTLQSRLFSTLLGKNYSQVTRLHSQEWINRINDDSVTVAQATCMMAPSLAGVALHLLGAIYLLYKAAPSFMVFIAFGGIAIVVLNYSIKKPVEQAQRSVRNSMGRKSIYVSEHLSKLMVVKAFNRESIASEGVDERLINMYQQRIKRLHILLLKDSLQNGSATIAYLAILIYCAFNIYEERITYGTCLMLLRLLSQVRAPLSDVSSYISNIFDVFVAAERLMEAESFSEDLDQPVKNDEEIKSFYENDFREIVFKDAGFSYLDELEADPNIRPTVFSDVNLTIPKKSLVAFTGMTGSGKSTLFKLLMSLYPLQEGSKMLCLNDGSEIDLDATYRRLFAYVPQGNQLMVGTVKEMVSFGDRDAKDSDIWEVLDTACAKDFIKALPQGLDTQIGERGLGLSEGQMQRLAIARALYTRRPILLLDEATSSLDEATEKRLLENIKAMTDCTIMIVTHRPAALSICNKEIHIDGNRVNCRNLKCQH